MSRLVMCALLIGACGGSSPHERPPASGSGSATGSAAAVDAAPPLPLDRDYPRLATASLALYVALATAFQAAGTDCTVATQQLLAVERDHAAVIAANATVVRDGREAELRAALRPREEAFAAAAQAVMTSPVLPACAQDPAFTAAFGALSGAP